MIRSSFSSFLLLISGGLVGLVLLSLLVGQALILDMLPLLFHLVNHVAIEFLLVVPTVAALLHAHQAL